MEINNLDEKIYDLLMKLKLGGFIRYLIFTKRVKWLRNLVARLLKVYRVKEEFRMLKRSQKLKSETQSVGTWEAKKGGKKFPLEGYNTTDRLEYLKSRYNKVLRMWFMEELY